MTFISNLKVVLLWSITSSFTLVGIFMNSGSNCLARRDWSFEDEDEDGERLDEVEARMISQGFNHAPSINQGGSYDPELRTRQNERLTSLFLVSVEGDWQSIAQ